MTVEEIMSGESQYLEFKREIPEKSEKYMKTVVAFANGSGGKIVFGIEDKICKVAGGQRPYYITAEGKEKGTYVRVSGTTRHADSFIIKELEFEGANRCFDQTYAAPHDAVTDSEIDQLCERMYGYAVQNSISQERAANIKRLTKQNLISWGFLVKKEEKYYPTNAYLLMSEELMPQVTI